MTFIKINKLFVAIVLLMATSCTACTSITVDNHAKKIQRDFIFKNGRISLGKEINPQIMLWSLDLEDSLYPSIKVNTMKNGDKVCSLTYPFEYFNIKWDEIATIGKYNGIHNKLYLLSLIKSSEEDSIVEYNLFLKKIVDSYGCPLEHGSYENNYGIWHYWDDGTTSLILEYKFKHKREKAEVRTVQMLETDEEKEKDIMSLTFIDNEQFINY